MHIDHFAPEIRLLKTGNSLNHHRDADESSSYWSAGVSNNWRSYWYLGTCAPRTEATVTVLIPPPGTAIINPEKVRDYLLSPTHPIGRFKATVFGELGYSQDSWHQLANDLRKLLLAKAELVDSTEYGHKFLVRGTIGRHPGRQMEVVAAWNILSGEHAPRFVTAYPGD